MACLTRQDASLPALLRPLVGKPIRTIACVTEVDPILPFSVPSNLSMNPSNPAGCLRLRSTPVGGGRPQREVADGAMTGPYAHDFDQRGKRHPATTLLPAQGLLTGTAVLAPEHRIPTPEFLPTPQGRRFHPGRGRPFTPQNHRPARPMGYCRHFLR